VGPAFSLEIADLKTNEVRSILVNAGWNDDCPKMYREWCDCGAAGYFNRGSVDREGKFMDSTQERHEAGATEYVKTHGCDHSKMTRFEIVRAVLQDGRIVELTTSAKEV
jgi:hypothetical protein